MALVVAFVYVGAWIGPGTWAGALGEALFGGVPEGWYFCFPNLQPAFLSGLLLSVLLPLMRPPRLSRVQFAVYGIGSPLVVTALWLAVNDPPLFHNMTLRWWFSNQIPAMLVASSLAVVAAFERMRLDESKRRPASTD
jgi:hypothetical protein